MKVLHRYLLTEFLANSATTILVLWLLFFSNQLVRFLNRSAFGALQLSDLWTVIILYIPKLLTVLLPASLFLGFLLTYSRLYINNEPLMMVVAGFAPRGFLAIGMKIGMVFIFVIVTLSLWIDPAAQRYTDNLMTGISKSPLQLLESEQFYQVPGSNLIARVDHKESTPTRHQTTPDDQFTAQEIFIAQTPPTTPAHRRHTSNNSDHGREPTNCCIIASRAETLYHQQQAYLSLIDGARYCGVPGQLDYEILSFHRYNLRLPAPSATPAGDESTMSMTKLWQRYPHSNAAAAEFQWRCSQPLSVLLLVTIATVLGVSRTPNRSSGRFAKFFVAILVYIFYVNFLLLSRAWLKRGLITRPVGLWWVHGVIFLYALWLAYRNDMLTWSGHAAHRCAQCNPRHVKSR